MKAHGLGFGDWRLGVNCVDSMAHGKDIGF